MIVSDSAVAAEAIATQARYIRRMSDGDQPLPETLVAVDGDALVDPHLTQAFVATIASDVHANAETQSATLASAPEPSGVRDSVSRPGAAGASQARYESGPRLGMGGMGEVRLYRDRTIGREVAMKVMRRRDDRSSGLELRFLREARVQGQLEHPYIVPVYDVDADASGALFFTMKRVRGDSLERVLAKLRDEDEDYTKKYSRRKLLTTFTSVCQAVHFAHSRGVLHRDLKPANIMLGDFGEVYVLDWGLAKVRGTTDVESGEAVDDDLGNSSTRAGEILGTPGYMSPEQVRGQVDDLDERTDVYALGVILFELLSFEPLHQGSTGRDRILSTLKLSAAHPGRQGADVPPELEDLCSRATAADPANRPSSAGALADAVEAYLDGDRDEALRSDLADQYARTAADAFDRSTHNSDEEEALRSEAMRQVISALGLAPEHVGARNTLVKMLTTPPQTIPEEVHDATLTSLRESVLVGARSALPIYFLFGTFVPLVYWCGLASPAALVFMMVTIIASAIATKFVLMNPPREATLPAYHVIPATCAVMASTVMFGPFIIVPSLALANTVSYFASTNNIRRWRIQFAGVCGVFLPWILQLVGFLPPSYEFVDGKMVVLPWLMNFPETATLVFLAILNALVVMGGGVFVARLRDSHIASTQQLHLQSWQLRQVVPKD